MDIHIFVSVSESYIPTKNSQMIVQNIIQKIMFMEQHSKNEIQRIKFGKTFGELQLEYNNQKITLKFFLESYI